MPSEFQLRDYHIKPGEMQAWIKEWRSRVLPLRLKFGFKLVGAWRLGEDRFIWILKYEGRTGDFQKADEKYYASRERIGLKPDPARHLSETYHHMVKKVSLPV